MKKESRGIAIKVCIIGGLLIVAWILSKYVLKLFDTEKDRAELQKALQAADVGDYVTLGVYEQDNDESNGKEPIEWLVLDKQDDRVLVISRYALDWVKFNEFEASVTWETCTLRGWLNDAFIREVFDPNESERILSTKVTADINPLLDTSPGNDTTDRIFLLSILEAERYFASDSERACLATEYCHARGSFRDADGYCWWWLRTPGTDRYRASYINHEGMVRNAGHVHDALYSLRPAMWLSTKP
ncbi:MAG: hypothetical protein IK125_08585 [Lachnospiraceae bacterium]|nr:hypothetical protein [Lachnospiraceae bacterium]